jgi:hypothetical protein
MDARSARATRLRQQIGRPIKRAKTSALSVTISQDRR